MNIFGKVIQMIRPNLKVVAAPAPLKTVRSYERLDRIAAWVDAKTTTTEALDATCVWWDGYVVTDIIRVDARNFALKAWDAEAQRIIALEGNVAASSWLRVERALVVAPVVALEAA